MKKTLVLVASATLLSAHAQERGNIAYDYGNYAMEGNAVYGNNNYYRNYYTPSGNNNVYLPNDSVYTIGARVMINVEPDAYVAVFAVQQEALTVAECNKQITQRIDKFKSGIVAAGIPDEQVFVDLIAQTRIYDYKIAGKTATETSQGFELKKNIIIKFTDHALLEKLMLLASEQEIYDIVKVDYLVYNTGKIQEELRKAALEIIESKKKFVTTNASLVLSDKGVIQYENVNTVFPAQAYRQYTAAETASVRPSYYNNDTWVKEQRKSKTFYFEKQSPAQFDKVLNADMVKIPVQVTLDISVRYYIGKPEKKTRK